MSSSNEGSNFFYSQPETCLSPNRDYKGSQLIAYRISPSRACATSHKQVFSKKESVVDLSGS